MRAEVLQGQARPEGLGALVYHGMVAGLPMLTRVVAPPAAAPLRVTSAIPRDRQFVCLLANMLRTQSVLVHVY